MGDLLDVGVADAAEDAPVELPLDDAVVHADVEELARGDVELSTGEPFLSDQLGCQLQAHRAPTDLAGDAPGDHQVGDAAVEQVADRRFLVEPRQPELLGRAAGELASSGDAHAEPVDGRLELFQHRPDPRHVLLAAPLHLLEGVEDEEHRPVVGSKGLDQFREVVDGGGARLDGKAQRRLLPQLGGGRLGTDEALGPLLSDALAPLASVGVLDGELPDGVDEQRKWLRRVDVGPVEVEVGEREPVPLQCPRVLKDEPGEQRRLPDTPGAVDEQRWLLVAADDRLAGRRFGILLSGRGQHLGVGPQPPELLGPAPEGRPGKVLEWFQEREPVDASLQDVAFGQPFEARRAQPLARLEARGQLGERLDLQRLGAPLEVGMEGPARPVGLPLARRQRTLDAAAFTQLPEHGHTDLGGQSPVPSAVPVDCLRAMGQELVDALAVPGARRRLDSLRVEPVQHRRGFVQPTVRRDGPHGPARLVVLLGVELSHDLVGIEQGHDLVDQRSQAGLLAGGAHRPPASIAACSSSSLARCPTVAR